MSSACLQREEQRHSQSCFITRQSVGISDASDPVIDICQAASTFPPQSSWTLHSDCRIRIGHLLSSSHQRDNVERQTHQSAPALPALRHLESHREQEGETAAEPTGREAADTLAQAFRSRATPQDPNIVGFVPAFVMGNIYVCQLPDSDDRVREGRLDESDPNGSSRLPQRVPAANLSLLLALGLLGPAVGLVGLFASKAAAQLVAQQTLQQAKPAAADPPVRKGSAAGHPIVTAAQRFAKAVKGTAAVQRFLHPLQNKKGEMDGSEEDQHMAGMLDAMSRAEKAMEQAADILKQLNQAAEELSMKERSVMPMPLAMGLHMVMNGYQRVCLIDYDPISKAAAQRAGRQEHKGKGHQAVREALQTGLTTYTIPGIAFGMPTSVGPLHFAPVFTSRRTAEIAWDVVRELLVTRIVQKRKLKRHLQRHATEMGAARLTGLTSRVEAQEGDEDEGGLNEPAEMADFLNELGEGDNRPSKNKTRFKPRGPLDLVGALACGVVSLYARTIEWSGNAADDLIFHSALGHRAIGLSGAPALQEQPLQGVLASARDWNRALQQTAIASQAIADQQSALAEQLTNGQSVAAAGSEAQAQGLASSQRAQHDGGNLSSAVVQAHPGQIESSPAGSQKPKSGAAKADSTPLEHRDGKPPFPPPEAEQATSSQSALDSSSQQRPSSSANGEGQDNSPCPASPKQAPLDGRRQSNNLAVQHPQPHSSPPDGGTSSPSADQSKDQLSSSHQQPKQHPSPVQPQKQSQPNANPNQQSSQQQQQQQHESPKEQQQQQQSLRGEQQQPHQAPQPVLRMPASIDSDVMCVLGSGEQLTMLDGLQGSLAGLAVKVVTGQVLQMADNVQSPFEFPIMSLKGGTEIDDSMADGTMASVHFDLSVATDKRAATKQKTDGSSEAVGQGLVLVGDIGLEKHKSARELLKAGTEATSAPIGFGNLSLLAEILEQQQV